MCRHNDERHNGGLASSRLETVIQSSQGLNEHVHTLIPEFVPAGSEEVECIVRLEIIVPVEMTAHKIVNLLFGLLVKILEFVNRRKLGDVEAVGQNSIGLSLQQVLRLEGSDVGHSGEDITRMSSGTLNAITVVDPTFSSL